MPVTTDVEPGRVRVLNRAEPRREGGTHVLYWMQQSQRAEHNPALEYAVQQANELRRPLLVGFGLADGYPQANLRHYAFMLEGLAEVAATLAERGIGFVAQRGSPEAVALRLGRDAALVVCDRGYLRHQKAWRSRLAREARCRVAQVESDVVVPVEAASDKREWAARTIRPKIGRLLDAHLVGLRPTRLRHRWTGPPTDALDLSGPRQRRQALAALAIDRAVPPVGSLFRGGTAEAGRRLRAFLKERFAGYARDRGQPQFAAVSQLSPYLHFGQVSPVWLALRVRACRGGTRADRESYLEELIVRRELAVNFVENTADYDRFSCLPAWARGTLARHAKDRRPHRYTRRQLEEAATHDPYWNAAMREMVHTGYMHNHMRMYWGKKILEWSASPQLAYRTALELNNRWFLDGRDPASYANVGWIFGLHDRPWGERPVFGTVRSMTASGLERSCDPEAYVATVDELVARVAAAGAGA